jgi:hypothetical protein
LKSGPPKSPRPKPKFDYKHTDENAFISIVFSLIDDIVVFRLLCIYEHKTNPLTVAIVLDIWRDISSLRFLKYFSSKSFIIDLRLVSNIQSLSKHAY